MNCTTCISNCLSSPIMENTHVSNFKTLSSKNSYFRSQNLPQSWEYIRISTSCLRLQNFSEVDAKELEMKQKNSDIMIRILLLVFYKTLRMETKQV